MCGVYITNPHFTLLIVIGSVEFMQFIVTDSERYKKPLKLPWRKVLENDTTALFINHLDCALREFKSRTVVYLLKTNRKLLIR